MKGENREMGKKNETPRYEEWYQMYVIDNTDDISQFSQAAAMEIRQKLKAVVDPKLAIAIYAETIAAYVGFLKTKQSDYTQYCMNILDMIELGYDTSDNEDDEKSGNFAFYMYDVESHKSIETDESIERSDEICAQWASSNISVDSQSVIREANAFAKDHIKNVLNVAVENASVILMIFLIVHDTILKCMKIKRLEEGSSIYQITVAGIVEITCQDGGDDEDRYFFKVEPSVKHSGKNDAVATGRNEV